MYAVISSGGKQYRVSEGDTIKVEKLAAEEGSTLEIPDVLMLVADGDIKVGTPRVPGCTVTATVGGHGRGAKLMIIKFRRRKHYMKRQGHRQWYTELTINSINAG